jgi:ferritin-like metal-binding protein YciE
VKSLPDIIGNANDLQLKQCLQSHLSETQNQVKRLEQVFQMLGQKAKSVSPALMGSSRKPRRDRRA